MQINRKTVTRGVVAAAWAILPGSAIFAAAVIAGSSAFAPVLQSAYSLCRPLMIAQSGQSDDDETEVAPADVERYIAVYKTMQHNHSLSIDQAAAEQGLSVPAFRRLESRIERDDSLRERVRKALRDSAESPPAPTPKPQAR